MAKISGILTDGAGQVINDCTIELYAKKTTSRVLVQTQAFKVAENGEYTMNVLPCEYDVSLIINGFPKKRLGTIQVFSDSLDGTLNDFLLNPSESEITPAILQQVIEDRKTAQKAAFDAQNYAQSIDLKKYGIGCRNVLSNVDSFQLNGFGFIDKTTTKGNKPFEYAEIIQSGDGKTEAVQIALDFFSNSVKIRSGRLNKWNEWLDFITTANASADIVGALPAAKLGDSPTYKVGAQVDFDVKPKINGIEPIYIVESYQNGDSWYNKYSNGFIEQSGLIVTNTNEVNKTIATNVNLLTPMSTKTYSIDLSLSVFLGSWGWIKYAWGDRYKNNFWICSFSESKMSSNTFRWTVRGY